MKNYYSKIMYVASFLIASMQLVFSQEKILVNIDRNIRELDEATSCNIGDWDNNLTNACKCCLVKKTPQLDQGKTAEEIISECIQKEHCTQALIDTLKGQSSNLASTLRALYDKSVIIKQLDVNGISFDDNGNFTEKGVVTFLERAYKEGKLPHDDFKSVTCLSAKNIPEEKGYATTQLFLINSTCGKNKTSYILKEMADKYTEARHLADFYGIKSLDQLIWPKIKPGYPSLAIPIALITYDNHYLSLMPTAPGTSLDKYMQKYISEPNELNKKLVKEAYFEVGRAMAKFHQLYMKKNGKKLTPTTIHGDLHHKNVFYDPAKKRVVLIDNERVPGFFKTPESAVTDIGTIFFVSTFDGIIVPGNLDKEAWLSMVIPAFLKGYVSQYPKNNRRDVLQEIIMGLKDFAFGTNRAFTFERYHHILDQYNTLKKIGL
ncbi:MAG: hypothetical protein WC707_03855 [Candidatus Babeliaceae bacterium]|jgi:serine/threonine protein kinase